MEGFICSQVIHSGGGLDEDGNPIKVSVSWLPPTECYYSANTLSNRGRYTDGSFTSEMYTITVPDMDFRADTILLLDSEENKVYEGKVNSLEVLEDIQRVKITV